VSQSGSQAAAFFTEPARHRIVWYVRDDVAMPASKDRALPYWSSKSRAQQAADIWGNGLRVVSMPLETWRTKDPPELADEGYQVGINWTGPRLTGWDFTVAEVLNRLAHALREGPYADQN
jgi:uncharacterized protein DUF2750